MNTKLLVIAGLCCIVCACGGGSDTTETQHQQSAVDSSPNAALSSEHLPIPVSLSSRQEAPTSSGSTGGDARTIADAGPTAHATAVTSVATGRLDIHVSPRGNDRWSGLLPTPNAKGSDGPVQSIEKAQAIARVKLAAMASSAVIRTPVRVLIQPGTYSLSAPLNFSALDSGTNAAPVSYEATTPGTVVITGSTRLSIYAQATATAPALFRPPPTTPSFWQSGGQLFVNGRRAVLARSPNMGAHAFIQRAIPIASEPTDDKGKEAFGATPDMLSFVAALSTSERLRAIVNIFHSWTTSRHYLADSPPTDGIRVTPRVRWTFLNSGTSQRYFIENISSALDAPGEFLWDNSGVRYIPRPDEIGTTLQARMPIIDKLITITGDFGNANWVQSLQFRGITFAHTRSVISNAGYLDWQSGINLPAAIEVDGAQGIVIDGCSFKGLGGYGVWLRRAVRDSSITNSSFDDLGGGGIKLGQESQAVTDVLQTGANSASGNRIGNTGKLYPGSVGILIGNSFDNNVTNNLVYNTSYSGISAGWTWGFAPASSGRNKISDNLLVNIGQGQLSDGAGIYLVGVAPGTVVSGNVVREVRGYLPYGAASWGIYADEGTSNVVISNNIALGHDGGSFQAHTSRSNSVMYNLFGLGDIAELNVGVTDHLTALDVRGNYFFPRTANPFVGYAKLPDATFTANLVSNQFYNGSMNLGNCGGGCQIASSTLVTTTDPRGVSVASADAAMTNRISQIAVKSGPINLTNASDVVTVATERPVIVASPPIPLVLDIANTPVGGQPTGFWYSAPQSANVLNITTNAGAPNGKCLQYTDSASNANGHDPHTYAPMNHERGSTTGEFSLLIDAQTTFLHQWRDNGTPALTGPSIVVNALGVYVNSRLVAPATVGSWMKFKVTAPLDRRGSTWSLSVTDAAGQSTVVNSLPFVHDGWSRLNWWGFVSNATVATKFCLAGVRATNVQ